MVTAGTWTHRSPTNDDIIEVFTSKSTYFKYYAKLFPKVPLFPAAQKWLRSDDDASSDSKIWDFRKPSFENLAVILNNQAIDVDLDEEKRKGGKNKDKEKGKKKEKEKEKSGRRKGRQQDSSKHQSQV
jgi:hypothetical protein